MATEQADAEAEVNADADADAGGVSDHTRAVLVTAVSALSGVAAAFVSRELTAGLPPTDAATSLTPVFAVFAIVAVQPAVLRAVGLLKDDFGAKDFLYLLFITFSIWFVTWGVLLTSGA